MNLRKNNFWMIKKCNFNNPIPISKNFKLLIRKSLESINICLFANK